MSAQIRLCRVSSATGTSQQLLTVHEKFKIRVSIYVLFPCRSPAWNTWYIVYVLFTYVFGKILGLMTTRCILRLFVFGIIMTMIMLFFAISDNLKFQLSTIIRRQLPQSCKRRLKLSSTLFYITPPTGALTELSNKNNTFWPKTKARGEGRSLNRYLHIFTAPDHIFREFCHQMYSAGKEQPSNHGIHNHKLTTKA